MAAPLIFRGLPLLRIRPHHNKLAVAASSIARRPWSAPAAESTRPDDKLSTSVQNTAALTPKNPLNYSRCTGDPDYRKWKDKEAEILRDVDPIILLTKFILHSDRYMDGECLTEEDKKAVVEKLLAYHPHSDDKIGSGLDSIMVDRHPLFKQSRCLFVVRTDGGWIDFSYQKCLRAYIRMKYPTHAERFIKEHFKRTSS